MPNFIMVLMIMMATDQCGLTCVVKDALDMFTLILWMQGNRWRQN